MKERGERVPFPAGQCPGEVSTEDRRQLRGEGWQEGAGPGCTAAPQPPCSPRNPANPSSCLAFPFLAKITPEHVSTLSCKESHFREAFSFSLSFPL